MENFVQSPLNIYKNAFLYRTLPAILASGTFALLLSGCAKNETTQVQARPALSYRIPATSGSDNDVFAGDVHARIEADHAFRVGGKISQRLVDAGATVKKGQVLARIDPQDLRFAADAGKAQVAAQQTEADYADAELKRFQDLFMKGFVSKSALDQKVNLANAGKARLNAARAQSSVSINQEGYATLTAETSGVVTQVMAEAGQVVAAGQPVMKIANPQEKELSISVPEAKIGEFKGKDAAARELRVGLWSNPGKYYKAKIREIGGAADPVTRTYAVRISLLETDDAIQLGMSAYAVFAGANEANTLAVPLSAHAKIPAVIIICIGFAAAGIGIGPMVPAFMNEAARVPNVAPSVALARVNIIGLAAFFIGPTLTGGVSQLTSLPIALYLSVLLLIFTGYQSRVISS